MAFRTWRSAARSFFSDGTTMRVRRDAVSTRSKVKGETHAYWAESVEAEAIAAQKRELQKPYPVWRSKDRKARLAALAERERAFREGVTQRRRKDLVDLEAAIQAINDGRWPAEEKEAAQ
jgi:hypothetical protein